MSVYFAVGERRMKLFCFCAQIVVAKELGFYFGSFFHVAKVCENFDLLRRAILLLTEGKSACQPQSERLLPSFFIPFEMQLGFFARKISIKLVKN